MTLGERIAAEALALVGARFRLHGRDEHGLDCVGLVALAAARAGHEGVVPTGYGLRGGELARIGGWLEAAGLRAVDETRVGDVALVRAGPGQVHLMIVVTGGHVHAHAGLRRVVMMPGASPWRVIGVWRVEGATQLRSC